MTFTSELHEVELCTLNFIPRWAEIRVMLAFCLLIRAEVLQLLLWKKNLVAGMRFPATNNLPRLDVGAISGARAPSS